MFFEKAGERVQRWIRSVVSRDNLLKERIPVFLKAHGSLKIIECCAECRLGLSGKVEECEALAIAF